MEEYLCTWFDQLHLLHPGLSQTPLASVSVDANWSPEQERLFVNALRTALCQQITAVIPTQHGGVFQYGMLSCIVTVFPHEYKLHVTRTICGCVAIHQAFSTKPYFESSGCTSAQLTSLRSALFPDVPPGRMADASFPKKLLLGDDPFRGLICFGILLSIAALTPETRSLCAPPPSLLYSRTRRQTLPSHDVLQRLQISQFIPRTMLDPPPATDRGAQPLVCTAAGHNAIMLVEWLNSSGYIFERPRKLDAVEAAQRLQAYTTIAAATLHFGISSLASFRAVTLMDRRLAVAKPVPHNAMLVMGCAALLLSAKVCDTNHALPVRKLAAFVHVSEQAIKEAELELLEALDYNVQGPSVRDLLFLMCELFGSSHTRSPPFRNIIKLLLDTVTREHAQLQASQVQIAATLFALLACTADARGALHQPFQHARPSYHFAAHAAVYESLNHQVEPQITARIVDRLLQHSATRHLGFEERTVLKKLEQCAKGSPAQPVRAVTV